jgi:hypothetical protein
MRRSPGLAALATCLASLAHAETTAWHDVPVPGGAEGLLRAAGLDPGLERWRVLFELSRRLHATFSDAAPDARRQVESFLAALPRPEGTLPLPLSPETWRRAVFERPVPDEALLAALLGDRGAALLYRGLAQLDPRTLAFLERRPETLRALARHGEAFSAFAGGFRVRDGRVAVPGGTEAEPLWEAAVEEPASRPERFLSRLVERHDGRLALLYDTVARLDPPRQRFALGLAVAEPERSERFRELVSAFLAAPPWWRSDAGAFTRAVIDPASVLVDAPVAETGGLLVPAGRSFWEAVFGEGTLDPAWRSSPPVDAAWLAHEIGLADVRVRRLRRSQLDFARRVFPAVEGAAGADAVEALAGLRRSPALVLTLERLDVRDPAVYVRALRHAEQLAGRAVSLTQVQGAMALLERSRFAGALDGARAQALLGSLLDVPVEDGQYDGRLAAWMDEALLPALRTATYGAADPGPDEQVVVRAMTGARLGRALAPPFSWEGLRYRADPAEAALVRLERVRERQGGEDLDRALARARAARSAGARDRIPRVRQADTLLAETLAALAYAPHLGAPDGPALAGASVAARHVLGGAPWALPAEVVGPGQPWHVQGALLGLDIALARLALRRLGSDMPDRPPGFDARTRDGFAQGVVLMRPDALEDEGRDAIVAAIGRGRERVRRLAEDAGDLEAVVGEAGLGAFREQALRWVARSDPQDLGRFFSLLELFWLGRPGPGDWDAWGAPVVSVGGGLRLRLPRARPLEEVAGQRLGERWAARFPDLALRAALDLAERGLPASLTPAVLGIAFTDLVEQVQPIAADDERALVRFTLDFDPHRVDDYIASLAGAGPLRPARAASATP